MAERTGVAGTPEAKASARIPGFSRAAHQELRSKQGGPSDLALEVWQLPGIATPEIKEPGRIAGLGGHKLPAPRRNRAAIENAARGLDAVAREAAAYGSGMAMQRWNRRRVLDHQPLAGV